MINKRHPSIDFTRGLVMIIMALDHVRDLMHVGSLTEDPTNLATTTPLLFMTRWITHLCAPTFVFLSGVSAYLSFNKHHNIKESQRFLITRGLWLIFLDFTVISLGIWFDIKFRIILFQVIACIGLGFILLAFLLRVSPKIQAIIAVVIVFGHNALALIPPFENISLKVLWAVFVSPNIFPVSNSFTMAFLYPVLPWFGIMLAGFVVGRLYDLDDVARRKNLTQIGLAFFSVFVLLRFLNIYGDPVPWSAQKNIGYTILSFINTTKYAPSLLFTLMTLSVTMAMLRLSDGVHSQWISRVSIYGKVPLFYYIIHWYLVHTAMLIIVFLQGYSWESLQFGAFKFGRPEQGSGVSLPSIYLIWACVVLVLYPLCLRYSHYKAANSDKKWLRYF